jgi:hypothetical protein
MAFDSNRQGTRNIYEITFNEPGRERLLFESSLDKLAQDWSPDGRFLLFTAVDPQLGWDIWALPLEGERKAFEFLKTSFDERRPDFSPDGRWVTYASNESGVFEVYVRPFRDSGGQWQVSNGGGSSPRWRTHNEINYIAPDGSMMAVPITFKGSTIDPGLPVALFRTRIVGGGTDVNLGVQYDISPDGRFLINTTLDDVGTTPITLLQNWKFAQ